MLRFAWQRFESQSGAALPMAVWLLLVLLLFAGAASASGVWSSSQSSRDRETKRAVAGADAAIESAVERLNSYEASATDCVTETQAEPGPSPGQWCPIVTEQQDDGTTTSYRLQAATSMGGGSAFRRIVGLATVGKRTRAVTTTVRAEGNPVFEQGVLGLDKVVLDGGANGNARIVTDEIGTNGSLHINTTTSHICGRAVAAQLQGNPSGGYGPRFNCEAGTSASCSGLACFSVVDPDFGFAAAPPKPDGDVQFTNDRISWGLAGCPAGNPSCDTDPIQTATGGTVTWDAAACASNPGTSGSCDLRLASDPSVSVGHWKPVTRELQLKSNVQLNLSGGDYTFCELHIEDQAKVFIAEGHSVNIWMDHKVANQAGAPPYSQCPGGIARPLLIGGTTVGIQNGPPGNPNPPSSLSIKGMGTRDLLAGTDDCNNSNNPTMSFWKDDQLADDYFLPVGLDAPAWCLKVGNSTPGTGSGKRTLSGGFKAQIIYVLGTGRLEFDPEVREIGAGSQPVYLRVANWKECKPIDAATLAAAGDPASTC